MIATNDEESEQRSEAVEELQDESRKTVQTPNNEASERGNEAVEELQGESKEVVQDIHLYYKNQMTNKHKIKEKELNKIVHRDIRQHDESKKVELRIYYDNRKVKNLFIKNNNKPVEDYNVVYQFNCDKVPCNEEKTCYIGHTTTTIKERTKQHSSIKKHYKETHNCNITCSQILPNIKILAKLSGKADLMILEALLIKQQCPMINIQAEDFNRVLKIF